MEATKKPSAEGFINSVFKYSISTFANIGILGASMLLTGLFIAPDTLGQINLFLYWTNTIMTIAILGLDQSLIRFYYELPANLTPNGLFRLCFYFSSGALALAAIFGSTFFLAPIYTSIGFYAVGSSVVPLLFLNAFFYMIARYFNVLYRMEGNIFIYSIESVLMQFFYKLFYVIGAFLGGQNIVFSMLLCSVLGLGSFALAFSFVRRNTLRPIKKEFNQRAYATLLPYGFAVAPTAVMLTLNSSLSQSVLYHKLNAESVGIYSYAFQLSNIVSMVQGGFASFWGPYMFANYKTQQNRIKRVHGYLNLLILCFFAFLVALQDVIFIVLPRYIAVKPIFPLMMLAAVFTILCETTVYGNAIARRPIFDTIGIGLSLGINILFVFVLAPQFKLLGAAAALALANFAMFAFRTLTAQRLYKSIKSPIKTGLALLIAVFIAASGTAFAQQFVCKLLCCILAVLLLCVLYKNEFFRICKLFIGLIKNPHS